MIYQILRNNIVVASVRPDDSSSLSQKKQSEDIVRLNFTLEEYFIFEIGDYISFEKTEQLYYLNKKPRVTESPKNYQYECIFEGSLHELRKTKIFFDTAKSGGGFYRDYKFPLAGNAQTFLDFIVSNLNRTGLGYTSGVAKATATTTIQFNNWSAAEAVFEIANQLGFGWYLNGKQLNFDEKALEKAYVFQVGRKLGFTQLIRTRVASANLETVVYGYGSTSNLPPRTDVGGGATYDGDLLTENRLSFEGISGESKLENNVALYGSRESVQEFDNIKPEKTGGVTAINATDVRQFQDTSIEFDINVHLLPGITPKINWLSGTLLGLNFNVAYNDVSQTFTMDYFTDESGQYPNSIQKPSVNDSYVLFDIAMPATYITEAQVRLQLATQEYLDQQSNDLDSYEGVIDEEFIQANNIVLDLGDLIRIVSPTFEIDNLYEIKELTQNLNNPYKYTIKFGDVLPKSLVSQVQSVNFATQQSIYNIERNTYTTTQVNNEVTNVIESVIEWEAL